MTAKGLKKRNGRLDLCSDRPGVLNKISMLIRRKMYNVETITACKTHRPASAA
jgi:acetolactate synthase-1/3 small subunit